jgi:iron complex transport system substrate-binding protein
VKNLPLWILAALVVAALAAHLLGSGEGVRGYGAPRVLAGDGFPLTVEQGDGNRLVLEAPPRRVFPANAGVVDFLSVLCPPGRLVGMPAQALHYARPEVSGPAWQALPRFDGYSAEVVLALEPDLVLTHSWQSPETTARLRESGIPVLVAPLPRSWDEILATLRLLGRILAADEHAARIEEELAQRLERLRGSTRSDVRALSYSNLGAGGTTAGTGTTIDVIFELAGVTNVAAAAGLEGHAALDHERLLAFDPDLIVVAAGDPDQEGDPTSDYLASRPELASLSALRTGSIVALPARLFATTSLELLTAAEVLQAEIARLVGDRER